MQAKALNLQKAYHSINMKQDHLKDTIKAKIEALAAQSFFYQND